MNSWDMCMASRFSRRHRKLCAMQHPQDHPHVCVCPGSYQDMTGQAGRQGAYELAYFADSYSWQGAPMHSPQGAQEVT